MLDLTTIDNRLDALQEALPTMRAQAEDEGDFWMAFAGEADHLEDCAGPHAAHVAQRIREMLIIAGLPLVDDIEDVL
jgi:hypothetical protein